MNPTDLVKEAEFVMFSKENCIHCLKAKALLMIYRDPGTDFVIHEAPTQAHAKALADKLETLTWSRKFPQVFERGQYIGGYKELLGRF